MSAPADRPEWAQRLRQWLNTPAAVLYRQRFEDVIAPTAAALFLGWIGVSAAGFVLKAIMQDAPLLAVGICVVAAVLGLTGAVTICLVSDALSVSRLGAALGLWTPTRGHHRLVVVAVFVGLGVIGAAATWFLTTYVTTPMFPRPAGLIDDRADGYSPSHPILGWLGQGIENGLPEELVFRTLVTIWAVIVMPLMSRSRVRWASAGIVVAATAAAFAATHSEYGMWNMSSAFCSGVIFGGLAVATRSVWPSVIAHTTYNTLALVL